MIRRNRRESSGRICIIPRNSSFDSRAFLELRSPAARRHPVSSPSARDACDACVFPARPFHFPRAPSRDFDASPPRLYIVTRRRIFRRGHPRSRSGRVVHSAPRAPALVRAHSSLASDARVPSRVVPPSRAPSASPLPGSLHLWRFAARVSPTHAFAASSAARAPAIFSSIFAMRSSESSNASMCLT